VNGLTVQRRQVSRAFKDPYGESLTRQQIVLLVDYYSEAADGAAKSQFRGKLYRVVVEGNFFVLPFAIDKSGNPVRTPVERKLRLLARYKKLDFSTRNQIAGDQFDATWDLMLAGIWQAHVWHRFSPAGVSWHRLVEGWLGKKKFFDLSGKSRLVKKKGEKDYERWVFTPPADPKERARVLAGQHSDFESFVSFFIWGTDHRANTAARRAYRKAGLTLPLDPNRTNGSSDEQDDDSDE